MHKETVNTFTKGMVKDTHPLTTPADVLTDCLNGTLITYNGNEMILQNDMGNVLIGSAELPAGYIPVGITEYGGIIYVAAYNPLTGKSLIGSFPSPLLRHMSEIWTLASKDSLTSPSINLSSFYSGNNIVSTEIRQPLSLNERGENKFKLYPGDKFQIGTVSGTGTIPVSVPSSILPYVDIQFGIIKKDGTIEMVNDLNYIDGSPHVYTGKSSGYPILIVKLKTIKSFNLSRTYSRGTPYGEDPQRDTVNIAFNGTVEEEVSGCFEGLSGEFTISDGSANQGIQSVNDDNEVTVINLHMDGTFKYELYPRLELGNMESMKKIGIIDLSKFRDNRKEITAWSYLVLDNYIKINWSFDYYSLDDSIDSVLFVIYDLATATALPPIDIVHDNYNGSFELIVNFDENFRKDSIYIVQILGFKNGVSERLGSRMLYTSGIFNNLYGRVTDFTNDGFTDAAPEMMSDGAFLDSIKCKVTATVTPIEVTFDGESLANPINSITVKSPDNQVNSYRSFKNLLASSFTARTDNTGSGYFTVAINKKYKFQVDLSIDVLNPKYGVVSDATKEAILRSYANSTIEFVNKNIKQGNLNIIPAVEGDPQDSFELTLPTYSPTGEIVEPEEPDKLTLKFEKVNGEYTPLSLTTDMRVRCTSVKTAEIKRTCLRPLYQSSLKVADKDKVLTCWNVSSPRMCCGADENDIHYNSTLNGGSVTLGISAGAGRDDVGLNTAMEQMNLPMVSMFAGIDGDQASYSPEDTVYDIAGHFFKRGTINGWGCDDNEIDDTDNWLITTWKQSDNQYRFLNLASRRTEELKGSVLARLDVMLRCLLSLILTTLLYMDSVKYVTTNASELAYYDTNVEVSVNLELIPNYNYDDVEYTEGKTTKHDILYGDDVIGDLIDARVNEHLIDRNEVLNIKYNYIIEEDTPSVLFGSEFMTNDIASLFTGAEFLLDEGLIKDGSNPKVIYVIDWSKVSASNYNISSDGTYDWNVSDFTSIAKVSGYPNGTNFDITIPDFNPLNSNSPCYSGSLSSDCSDTLKMSWNGNSDWYFYNSFNHVFMTYCRWLDIEPNENEYNEIVVNRDSGHLGTNNARGMWRKRKDDDAPDIIAALSNRQNSIYRRFKGTWLNPTTAN